MTNEPNPPTWPESVIIVHGHKDEAAKAKLNQTQDAWLEEHSTFTCDYHFSNRRWAVLFAPDVYHDVEFEVGYYVQVAGLGTSPEDVQFHTAKGPYVPSLNRHLHKGGSGTCLDTFWRSGENFANHAEDGMTWAVSQASPLRRVHVAKDLYLHDKDAYASGGHLANSVVHGHTHFGGQQQYLSRNVELGNGTSGGAWGMVYVGCSGQVPEPAKGNATSAAITVVETPPVRVEKPYVAMQTDGHTFELRVPQATYDKADAVRPLIHGDLEEARDFSRVRVATSTDSTASLQEALDAGKDLVLSPGIYPLAQTLQIRMDHQVILGLGLATLVSPLGAPCIHVHPGTAGVRIAGVMLEAPVVHGTIENATHWSLLEWGTEGVQDLGNPQSPGSMFDVFCRVGGATLPEARDRISIDTMVRIHSGHVIGDNLWLWRADHAELGHEEDVNCPHVSPVFWQTEEGEFTVGTGIEVTGNDVTMYGLAVEHASGHQTVWKGERGSVYFYQCEFPYDVGADFGTAGYRGYLVDENVETHQAYSVGIYSNFRNEKVKVSTAIEHPDKDTIRIENPFTVHLDNHGDIESLVNGKGRPAVLQGVPTRLD